MGIFDFLRRNSPEEEQEVDGAAAEGDSATTHCFVLSKTVDAGDLSRASEVVANVYGPGYSVDAEENLVTVSRGDAAVGFLMHLPVPIPEGEAEDCADGNFLWPNGKEEAAMHASHVIVTNVGAEDQTPVQSALGVSRLALVALDLFDGIGVYWGNASVCNSRKIFESFCESISEEHVPVPVWLRFQPFRTSNDDVGLYTVGMDQFGLMDIEVDRCNLGIQELFEFVSNLAHYVIQNGPVIEDGNTVGGSEEERILVRHRPSMLDEQRGVYKIVFESE